MQKEVEEQHLKYGFFLNRIQLGTNWQLVVFTTANSTTDDLISQPANNQH